MVLPKRHRLAELPRKYPNSDAIAWKGIVFASRWDHLHHKLQFPDWPDLHRTLRELQPMTQDRLIAEIGDAITAHLIWKKRLEAAVESCKPGYSPIVAASDSECAFGKWLHGPTIDSQVRESRPYGVVHCLHTGFHRSAGQLLTLPLPAGRQR